MINLDHHRIELLDEIDFSMVRSTLTIYLAQSYAANRRVCNYSDVSNYLKIQFNLQVEPVSSAMATILEEVSKFEHEQGDPLLSVIVVNKETKIPGDGFFKLAKELGLFKGQLKSAADKDAFFINELNRTHDLWEREYDPEWSEYIRLKMKFEGR